MLRKRIAISLACGTAFAAFLSVYVDKAYPGPLVTPSALWEICFFASLPGEFLSLLLSSGNHGIGIGIIDYRPALIAIEIATNAICYALLISFGWRIAARIRTAKQRKHS